MTYIYKGCGVVICLTCAFMITWVYMFGESYPILTAIHTSGNKIWTTWSSGKVGNSTNTKQINIHNANIKNNLTQRMDLTSFVWESGLPSMHNYHHVQNKHKKLKTILYWTNIFGTQKHIPLGQKPFFEANCNSYNCHVTTDKLDANQSAAIIFHMRDVSSQTVFPSPRLSHQNWVFYLKESPEHLNLDLDVYRGMFNLTMTYRLDSDIPLPYGKFIPLTTSSQDDNHKLQITTRNTFQQKKGVVWFVSNCVTPSRREDFVRELKKHIRVDIYGKCGRHKCPREKSDECYQMAERNYKFYLSFENSLCKDYVTEKAFRILKYNIVPVVLGSADYRKVLPPGSFINALDFQSPRELSDYLTDLGHDENRYMEYFKWKSRFEVVGSKPLCSLCEYVNRPHQYNVYHDIHQWWNEDAHCDRYLIPRLKRKWRH